MALKRKVEQLEVNEIECMEEPCSTPSIHGIISSLSPVEKYLL